MIKGIFTYFLVDPLGIGVSNSNGGKNEADALEKYDNFSATKIFHEIKFSYFGPKEMQFLTISEFLNSIFFKFKHRRNANSWLKIKIQRV